MWWIVSVLMALYFAFVGYKRSKRAGLWSWSKFAFSLGFALIEVVIVTAPLLFLNLNSRFFWPVYGAAWAVAAVFFVLFIIKARQWKLPDGRTSLQAEREANRGR